MSPCGVTTLSSLQKEEEEEEEYEDRETKRTRSEFLIEEAGQFYLLRTRVSEN